ncbi:hypothetical protein TrVE_jg12483 [Triparma verrucosa]|uniref:Uncharacterized protein n=1 Tax=Triparma verrucosa TaxID=1606542 RepID=A0A9W7CGC6_9STRA|nr:hypothetical protein TrVE_jg12483 [Triparma verrucosa]
MEAEGKQRRGSVGAMNAERFGKKVQTQKTSRGNPNLSKNNKERDNNALEDDDDNDNEGLASPSPVTTASLANRGASSSRLMNHKCSTPDCGSTTDCEKDPLDGKWHCPS